MNGQRNNFDAIRLLAAALVLFSHSLPIYWGYPDPLQVLVRGRFTAGDIAVDTFFIASGYLVTQSWLRDPMLLRYLARRFLRLCPALYLNILLAALVFGPLLSSLPVAAYFQQAGCWRYLQGVFIFPLQSSLPGVFEDSFYRLAFNGPLWTIRIEAFCYFLLPLFAVLGLLRRPAFAWLLAGASIALFAFLICESRFNAQFLGMDTLSVADLGGFFFTGGAFYLSRRSLSWDPQIAFSLLSVLFLLFLAPHSALLTRVYLHVALPYLVLWLAFRPIPALQGAGRHGDFSYGIYLYAWPVQQALAQWINGRLPVVVYILLCFLLTGLFAFLSWHAIEKYALRLKPRAR